MTGFMGMGMAQMQGANLMETIQPNGEGAPQFNTPVGPESGSLFASNPGTNTSSEENKKTTDEMKPKFCSNCGTPVNGKFCSNCGKPTE